jgi:hypothetical protein
VSEGSLVFVGRGHQPEQAEPSTRRRRTFSWSDLRTAKRRKRASATESVACDSSHEGQTVVNDRRIRTNEKRGASLARTRPGSGDPFVGKGVLVHGAAVRILTALRRKG